VSLTPSDCNDDDRAAADDAAVCPPPLAAGPAANWCETYIRPTDTPSLHTLCLYGTTRRGD